MVRKRGTAANFYAYMEKFSQPLFYIKKSISIINNSNMCYEKSLINTFGKKSQKVINRLTFTTLQNIETGSTWLELKSAGRELDLYIKVPDEKTIKQLTTYKNRRNDQEA